MSHAEIIKKLGIKPLADALGVKRGRVDLWVFRNNIPPAHWLRIARVSKKLGFEVTPEQLEANQ